MTPKPFLFITIAALTILISSCKTYFMPVGSFLEQVPSLETVNLRQVTTKDPGGFKSTYSVYPIDSIKCFDKDGTSYMLKNGPSIEIRFTDVNGKRSTFYFDRTWVVRDSVIGVGSRIFSQKKTIPVSTIKTIEIQDGHKKYLYIN
jgi:hypothetical protein